MTQTCLVIQTGEKEAVIATDVATAIKQLKPGKAAGGDQIRPEMLKSFAREGILWLTVCVNWHSNLEKHRRIGKQE